MTSAGVATFNGGNRPAGGHIRQSFSDTVQAGVTVSVSLQMFEFGGGAEAHGLLVEIYSSSGSVVQTNSYTIPNNDNITENFDFVVPAGQNANSIQITNTSVTNGGIGSDVRVDNVSVIADVTSPTITISGVPAVTDGTTPFTATFTFSEVTTGFSQADINAALGNAAASAFTVVSASVYTALITPNGAGDVTVGVNANVAQDLATNGNTAATDQTATLDANAPGVQILNAPSQHDRSTAFTITVQFSEDVTGFVQSELAVTQATVSAFTSVDGNTYTAVITPSGNQNITIDVAAGVATDEAGNPNTAANQVLVSSTINEETRKAIATFMSNRASHIMNNQPDLIGFVTGENPGGRGVLGNLALNANA